MLSILHNMLCCFRELFLSDAPVTAYIHRTIIRSLHIEDLWARGLQCAEIGNQAIAGSSSPLAYRAAIASSDTGLIFDALPAVPKAS